MILKKKAKNLFGKKAKYLFRSVCNITSILLRVFLISMLEFSVSV